MRSLSHLAEDSVFEGRGFLGHKCKKPPQGWFLGSCDIFAVYYAHFCRRTPTVTAGWVLYCHIERGAPKHALRGVWEM